MVGASLKIILFRFSRFSENNSVPVFLVTIRRVPALLLVVGLLPLASCDKDSEIKMRLADKENMKSYAKMFHGPNKKYPEGYMELYINGTLFRVPREYVGSTRDENITIALMWPEMIPKQQTTRWSKNDQLDVVYVFLDNKERPRIWDPDKHDSLWEQKISRYDGPYSSEEFPKYWEYRFNGKPFIYQPKDQSVRNPLGQPWHVRCEYPYENWDKKHALPPQCNSHLWWPNGLSLRIRFFRKHLDEAMGIYKAVMALRESFIVKEDTFEYERGE